MQTTTFNQVIGETSYRITVPVNRVETIINRVDRFIERKKLIKAFDAIAPFIGAAPVIAAPKPMKKVDVIMNVIEQHYNQGRYVVIDKLVAAGLSKSSAYYRARKAGL